MENNKIKIVFMGTPEFGAIILERLIKSEYKPILVITALDKPVGRKQIITSPPVKLLAEKYNIPISQPKAISNFQFPISKPDLIVVAAYGQIIPKEILEVPKYGCLNVHPSLLPRWRGPSPVQYTILNGDKETGITIMSMDEKMDHGPIVANNKKQITNNKITAEELLKELAELGAKLLIEIIPEWIKGEIKPQRQNESRATYTKILRKEDGKIGWQESAEKIEKQVRAFYPWPSTYTIANDKILKILKVRVLKTIDTTTYPIGKTLIAPQNELCVQTGRGFLVIERLQMEGKNEMASEDFLRGYPNFIGTILK